MTTITYKGFLGRGRKRTLAPDERPAEQKRASNVVDIAPGARPKEHRHAARPSAPPHRFITDVPRQQESPPRSTKRKTPTEIHDGPRIKLVKFVLDGKSEEESITRLVSLIEEKGPEKVLHEIEVHERKIAMMRTALQRFSDKCAAEALK